MIGQYNGGVGEYFTSGLGAAPVGNVGNVGNAGLGQVREPGLSYAGYVFQAFVGVAVGGIAAGVGASVLFKANAEEAAVAGMAGAFAGGLAGLTTALLVNRLWKMEMGT